MKNYDGWKEWKKNTNQNGLNKKIFGSPSLRKTTKLHLLVFYFSMNVFTI
jgi:hypothetical protein